MVVCLIFCVVSLFVRTQMWPMFKAMNMIIIQIRSFSPSMVPSKHAEIWVPLYVCLKLKRNWWWNQRNIPCFLSNCIILFFNGIYWSENLIFWAPDHPFEVFSSSKQKLHFVCGISWSGIYILVPTDTTIKSDTTKVKGTAVLQDLSIQTDTKDTIWFFGWQQTWLHLGFSQLDT